MNILNEFTFGNTPAALHLVRKLNEYGTLDSIRSVSHRITTTKTHVAELVAAYQSGFLSPKTLANTLRLMREEVTNSKCNQLDRHLHNLCQNVQIGAIKQAMRLAQIARKAETRMADYQNKTILYSDNRRMWYEAESKRYYTAGRVVDDTSMTKVFTLKEAAIVTPEILNHRSNKRMLNKKSTQTSH